MNANQSSNKEITNLFILEIDINWLRQLLHSIAQVVLQMTLLTLIPPPFVSFLLDSRVVKLEQ